jgi:exopolysaccharide production protein ExoQ
LDLKRNPQPLSHPSSPSDGTDWIALFDRLICYLLMMEVIVLPLSQRRFLHASAITLLAGLWIAKMVVLKTWLWRRTPLDFPILFFAGWVFLSSLLSTHPRYSLGEFRTEAITYFFFFYVAVNHIRSRRAVEAVFSAIIAGSAVMSIYGIYEFFAMGGNWSSRLIRIGSLTHDYNYASTYFILVIPIILYRLAAASSKTIRFYLLSFLMTLNLLSLYFTFTRAAWLGLAVSLVVLSLYRGKKTMVATSLGIGLALALLLNTTEGRTFYKNMGGAEGGRTPVWEFGMNKISEHPFFGIGYGRKNMAATFPEENKMIQGGFWHLHNTFLETALETGIPGGIFLVILVGALVFFFAKGYRSAPDASNAWLMIIMTMIVFAFFTRNMLDHIYVDAPAVLFWLLMGLGISQLESGPLKEG